MNHRVKILAFYTSFSLSATSLVLAAPIETIDGTTEVWNNISIHQPDDMSPVIEIKNSGRLDADNLVLTGGYTGVVISSTSGINLTGTGKVGDPNTSAYGFIFENARGDVSGTYTISGSLSAISVTSGSDLILNGGANRSIKLTSDSVGLSVYSSNAPASVVRSYGLEIAAGVTGVSAQSNSNVGLENVVIRSGRTGVEASNGGILSLDDFKIDAFVSRNGSGSIADAGISAWYDGHITAANGKITMHGDGNFGIVSAYNSAVAANRVSIITNGKSSYGLAVFTVTNEIPSLDFKNGSIITKGQSSIGVYANGINTQITISGSIISTIGENSHAYLVRNGGIINSNKTSANISGNGAVGVAFLGGSGNVTLENGSSIISERGFGIAAQGGGIGTFNLNKDSYISGKNAAYFVDGQTATTLNIAIRGNSVLDGRGVLSNKGIAHLNVDDHGFWVLDGNSQASSLTVNNSKIVFKQNAFNENGGNGFNMLTVTGDYRADNATFIMNTQLGDDQSPTDFFHVKGNASGTSFIQVTNRGGLGTLTTGNGIQLVQVDGTSASNNFELRSDYEYNGQKAVVGGAYAYSLYAGDMSGAFNGDWYLRSLYDYTSPPVDPTGPTPPVIPIPVYQPGTPLYEVYPQVLQQMNKLSTLERRVGDRTWLGTRDDNSDAAMVSADGRGFWMKFEGSTGHVNPDKSTTGADYDINLIKTQLGLDVVAVDSHKGRLVGGAYFQYSHAKVDVGSHFGEGDIKTDGYGVGSTLTWYSNSGFYIDGVGQYMWYDTDIKSDWLDRDKLVNGNDGTGYALSIEAGRKTDINHDWTMTPQAQLSYSAVNFDSFHDAFDVRVKREDGDALTGRVGVAFNREKTWKSEAGDLYRLKTYGIGNFYYEFLDVMQVNVAGVDFSNRPERFWGGFGTGVSYNWKDDTYSLYGEVDTRTAFSDFADSYLLNGTVGLKIKW